MSIDDEDTADLGDMVTTIGQLSPPAPSSDAPGTETAVGDHTPGPLLMSSSSAAAPGTAVSSTDAVPDAIPHESTHTPTIPDLTPSDADRADPVLAAIATAIPARVVVRTTPSDPMPSVAASPPEPDPEPPTTMLRLVHRRRGGFSGHVLDIFGTSVVGRFDQVTGPVDVDLTPLPDAGLVSRRHAVIERLGDSWELRDAGSVNGVFLRPKGAERFGPRLTRPTPIGDGDEIAFGNLHFLVRVLKPIDPMDPPA